MSLVRDPGDSCGPGGGPASPDVYAEARLRLEGRINYERRPEQLAYDERTFKLDRFTRLLGALDDPQLCAPAVHVAGTCGKGSTVLILETLLRSFGLRVATYTSPHFRDYPERIRIDGTPIGEEEFARLLERVESVNPGAAGGASDEKAERAGFETVFEQLTAMFFLAAREHGADRMIVETGLGGRLDSTNALPPGPVALTRIDLEHTRLLGSTVEEIAREKAAILKPGGWGVCAPQSPAVRAEFRRRAEETDAPLHDAAELAAIREVVPDENGLRFGLDWFGERLELAAPVLGPFQIENLSTALAVTAGLARRGEIERPSGADLARALARVSLTGRMQRVGPGLIADSAHCPAAARAVAETMSAHFAGRRAVALVALSTDKDHAGFFRELAAWPGWAGAVVWGGGHPRLADPALLERAARPFFPLILNGHDLDSALGLIRGRESLGDHLIVSTGSCFGVWDVIRSGRAK